MRKNIGTWAASLVFAFVALVAAEAASAGGLTFYGLELGAPLNLPPCVSTNARDRNPNYKGPCRIDGKGGAATVMWIGTPGPNYSPKGLDSLDVKLIDGRIERIEQTTAGLAVQDAVLGDLTAKFGTPKHLEKRTLGNAFGQRYEGIVAGWHVGDVVILFYGLEDTLDYGRIEVSTNRDRKVRENQIREQKKQRPKM